MKVLVINCGSSSLKYQLIDSETEQVLAKGICERIKLDGSLTHQATGGSDSRLDSIVDAVASLENNASAASAASIASKYYK